MAYQAHLLDGINIFTEVVKGGSFTAAALQTGHSTSYISKEINKLETRLGVRLMHRTTRSLSLTPEGEAYYQQCLQIVTDAQQAEQLLSGHQLEPKGTLKISCASNLAMGLLKPCFSEYLERYPEASLDLDLSGRKVDVVAEGFDLVIRATAQLDDSSLISRKLFDSYGITIASPEYLQRHGTPNHPAELKDHNIITYSLLKQSNIWNYQKNGETTQIESNTRVTTNSSEMELEMCLAGHGITRLPKFNLTNEIESGKLVELFPDYDKVTIGVYCIYPNRKHLSAKVRSFIDLVIDRLADH